MAGLFVAVVAPIPIGPGDRLAAPGALSPKLKELAYLRASILNGCAY